MSGWISKKKGRYVLRFYTNRASDGQRVEHSKVIGLASVLRSEKNAWKEAERLGYLASTTTALATAEPTFGFIANHFIKNELEKKEGQIGVKANETATGNRRNLKHYCIQRWGHLTVSEIEPTALEAWYESLHDTPLAWPTVGKIRSVMSQAINHGYRVALIKGNKRDNPVALSRCKTESDYEAKTVTPDNTMNILAFLNSPTTMLEWTLTLTVAATAARGNEAFGIKWEDILWDAGVIKLNRGWSKGKQTKGKTKQSMVEIPMHPVLAAFLKEWRGKTLYAADGDWVFASVRDKGKIPRAASTMAKDYLRPAAVAAGVLADGDTSTRFGWQNLRHSLASWLGQQKASLSAIQHALRHASPKMTVKYVHGVPEQQTALQGSFLDALKLQVPAEQVQNAGADAGAN